MELVKGVSVNSGRSTGRNVEGKIKGEQIGLSDGVVGLEAAEIAPVASPKVGRQKSPKVFMGVLRELSRG